MAVLRYPKEALHDTTDYLRIDVLNYDSVSKGGQRGGNAATREKGSLVRNVSDRQNSIAVQPGTFSPKKYTELTDSILLPMPSNIQDGNSVDYSDASLDGLTAAVYNAVSNVGTGVDKNTTLAGLANVMGDTFMKTAGVITTPEALNIFTKKLAADAANIPFGGNLTVGQILARESGQILNPNVELLFNGVKLRSFKFSFKMTPRDENEAKEIRKIIQRLKESMAPKIQNNTFLKSPDIYQLSYRKGPDIHPYLHLFKQCFLTDMSVNYTGEGIYATYSDGSPVSYVMDLSFKELEPIYANDYVQGDVPISPGF